MSTTTRDDHFVEEKAISEKKQIHKSPSGKYTLTVTPYATKPGCWNYSRGVATNTETGEVIADVKRNYGHFPFLFIEDHPNGHSYLLCGEDYQGQTVVELDTGKRVNNLSHGAKQGVGFCWADYEFNAEHQILVVDGCHWACPYEYKFFDFSDPIANGWPELEPEKWVDADRRKPIFNPDGTITCFQSEYVEDDDDEDTDDDEKRPVAATLTFRRDGLKLALVSEWVSDKEQANRQRQEEYRRQYDEWLANFKATDSLYLAMLEGLKDAAFSPEEYISIGQTHKDWCPGFEKNERRMCRRLHKVKPYTFDLEWGVDTGPVKLVIYKDGKHVEDKFWREHSVASIEAAFAYAKGLLGGVS